MQELKNLLEKLGAKLTQDIVPPGLYRFKCTYEMPTFKYVTLHNAATTTNAKNLNSYMHNCCHDPNLVNIKSWHFSVDENEIIQGLPLARNGWHAGDGNGQGNRNSIGIEICRDLIFDDAAKLYSRAEDNACKLAACLLYMKGYDTSHIAWHNTWMPSKPCPHRVINYNRKDEVIEKIKKYLKVLKTGKALEEEEKNILYCVQLGAFKDKNNAENLLRLIRRQGFKDAYIRESRRA